MIVRDKRATMAWPLHLADDLTATAMLVFDAQGRLVDLTVVRQPPTRETPAEERAALLVLNMAAKLRRTPNVTELSNRCRQALDLLDRLAELEAMHGAKAAAAIAEAREA